MGVAYPAASAAEPAGATTLTRGADAAAAAGSAVSGTTPSPSTMPEEGAGVGGRPPARTHAGPIDLLAQDACDLEHRFVAQLCSPIAG